jgi:hypothetical protein
MVKSRRHRSRKSRKRRGSGASGELVKLQTCLRTGVGLSACKKAAKDAVGVAKEALKKEKVVKAAISAAPIPTPKLAKVVTKMTNVRKAADQLKKKAEEAKAMSRGAAPELKEALRQARQKNLAGGKRKRRRTKRRRKRRKSKKSRRKSRKTKRRRKSKKRRSRRRR